MMALKYNVVCVKIPFKGLEKENVWHNWLLNAEERKGIQLQYLLPVKFKSFSKSGVLSNVTD